MDTHDKRNERNKEKLNSQYDEETGLPLDETYLEKGLPPYLSKSIEEMEKSWAIEDAGGRDNLWDCTWCNLNADINAAEVEHEISSRQAWYLRRKYLRMVDED